MVVFLLWRCPISAYTLSGITQRNRILFLKTTLLNSLQRNPHLQRFAAAVVLVVRKKKGILALKDFKRDAFRPMAVTLPLKQTFVWREGQSFAFISISHASMLRESITRRRRQGFKALFLSVKLAFATRCAAWGASRELQTGKKTIKSLPKYVTHCNCYPVAHAL